MGSTVIRPAMARLRSSGVGSGPDVLYDGTAVPGLLPGRQRPLQKVCVACKNDAAGLAKQAPVAETVMVVPCTEQPVLVWVQVVVYDAHEELETLLTQLTVQSEAILLAVQVGLELEIELAVVVSPDVGCVEDLFVLVGALEGESSGGGPSTLGGDVQPPTGIPKILIHGR